MGEISEEAQYEVVLKMVLWDEDRKKIFKRLEVNGIDKDRAEEIYRAARSERLQVIRRKAVRSILWGLGGIALAIAIYRYFRLDELSAAYFSTGVNGTAILPWLLGLALSLSAAFGIFKLIQGGSEYVLAANKKGSIADLE